MDMRPIVRPEGRMQAAVRRPGFSVELILLVSPDFGRGDNRDLTLEINL